MKKDKKGYSLIELLSVIFIIALIIITVYFGINRYINTSKKTIQAITKNNILNTALLYVIEYNKDLNGWHYEYNEDKSPNINQKYYCITVNELINKGYLNKELNKDNIDLNSYIKVNKDEINKTYTADEVSSNENVCKQYKISFVDRNNQIIKLNNENQQKVVNAGYQLNEEDFPNIINNSTYNQFQEGNSTFIYNGKWEDQYNKLVTKDYEVKSDLIIKIKYSLKSGLGDTYLLSQGQQRPFNGESDSSSRYQKGTDIVLTDLDGTSLADFVLKCKDTSNCVLSLKSGEIYNYLTLETKENFKKFSDYESIDWYVLKYVNGTWHLDGQQYSDINLGFIDLSKLGSNTNCRYLNNRSDCNNTSYTLALTMYKEDLIPTNIKIEYTNTTKEYNSFIKEMDNDKIINSNLGYYLTEKITNEEVQKIKNITVEYEDLSNTYKSTYTYNYNNGTYIFKLT